MQYILIGTVAIIFLIFGLGIRIIRPIEKGLIERLGKYKKTAEQGFHWTIPLIETMRKVNITEQMVDIPSQVIQTSDKLNTEVDAVVYYQVKDVMKAEYNVDHHQEQLTSLARTTLRAVMGKLTLTECIQERNKINTEVESILDKETKSYGVEVLRVEVQKIEPPQDVQAAMNNVVKAEQDKIAAKDYALAVETKADGQRMAEIKVAEGRRQARILEAEGTKQAIELEASAKAKAIEDVNTSAQKYFVGNAQVLRKLEAVEHSLENNAKIVVSSDQEIVNVIGQMAGVLPIEKKKKII
ncbi:paraslipin [Candidatus Woesearchaeota archaeon CG10_big_fil_rev_8_21_14_0_10_34_8]|nr:MAG: paraslipin [Candidatus Woesearchaeota archaeon CG10_big_fil_rev_8_21_14_0_10_34_8]